MKKLFLSFAFIALTGSFLSAHKIPLIYKSDAPKDAIHLVYGDASVLKDKHKVYELFVDFSQAEIVEYDKSFNVERSFGSIGEYNESHGEDYVRDWSGELGLMTHSTGKSLSNALRIEISGDKKADYRIVLKIGQFDFGHFVFLGSTKDGGTVTKGLLEVYDTTNDEAVAVFDVNYLRGRNIGYGDTDRMRQFGVYFAKGVKKAVK